MTDNLKPEDREKLNKVIQEIGPLGYFPLHKNQISKMKDLVGAMGALRTALINSGVFVDTLISGKHIPHENLLEIKKQITGFVISTSTFDQEAAEQEEFFKQIVSKIESLE